MYTGIRTYIYTYIHIYIHTHMVFVSNIWIILPPCIFFWLPGGCKKARFEHQSPCLEPKAWVSGLQKPVASFLRFSEGFFPTQRVCFEVGGYSRRKPRKLGRLPAVTAKPDPLGRNKKGGGPGRVLGGPGGSASLFFGWLSQKVWGIFGTPLWVRP